MTNHAVLSLKLAAKTELDAGTQNQRVYQFRQMGRNES